MRAAQRKDTILVCDARRPRPAPDMMLAGRRLLDPASWDMRMVTHRPARLPADSRPRRP